MNDPAGLQNLHDIVVSPPAPFWPPAPGWIFLLGLIILVLVFVLARAAGRYRRNAYRRAALAELRAAASSPQPLISTASLVKRTALAAYARDEVAALTGKAWVAWLSKTSGLAVPASVETALGQGLYGSAQTDSKELSDFAARWIRHHRGGPRC